jgi:hypothetical protein
MHNMNMNGGVKTRFRSSGEHGILLQPVLVRRVRVVQHHRRARPIARVGAAAREQGEAVDARCRQRVVCGSDDTVDVGGAQPDRRLALRVRGEVGEGGALCACCLACLLGHHLGLGVLARLPRGSTGESEGGGGRVRLRQWVRVRLWVRVRVRSRVSVRGGGCHFVQLAPFTAQRHRPLVVLSDGRFVVAARHNPHALHTVAPQRAQRA